MYQQLHFIHFYYFNWLPRCSVVKNLPARAGVAGSILGSEDPLEKEMATHSIILGWEIPWTEKPARLQSMGPQKLRHDLATEREHVPSPHAVRHEC